MKRIWKVVIVATLFSIAMALLETIVVVYLRELYYPNGFNFPFQILPTKIYFTEILREIATMIMLITFSLLAGRNWLQRLGFFLLAFGAWDIFYYIWLKALLSWPESFFTWDILFLIPILWVGPVLAPLINSVTMILIALLIISADSKGRKLIISRANWVLLISGTLIVLVTYLWDYGLLIVRGGFLPDFWNLAYNEAFIDVVSNYEPDRFNWALFFIGQGLMLFSIYRFWRYNKR